MKVAADPASLRIVLVEFLPSGGMFQFSFQFADALAKAGHRVTLLTGPDPELTSRTAGLEVVSGLHTWHPNASASGSEPSGLRRKLRRVGRALRLVESWIRVWRYLRRERADIAQFGELRFVLDAAAFWLVAKLVSRSAGTAFVDVAHNPLPYDVNSKDASVEKAGRLTRMFLTKAYEACALVLVLGEGPRDDLLREFPGVQRVAICGHGDYSSVLSPGDTPPPSSAPPKALFFGAWTKYKNIPLLLDAFSLVKAQLPESRLTLAGPVMPDVDLAEVTAAADRVGGVDLRPGYVAMGDLPSLFAGHRVVMFTYETVNISGSIHMAYTFGRPVVATNVGAMRDVVEDGVTGVLAESSAASVAAAMLQVLDPATADRMGAAAGRHADQQSSWSSVVTKALAGYRDALGLPTSPEPALRASGPATTGQ